MIEVKRKVLLKCTKCGSTDFIIRKEDDEKSSTTSIICLKCAHKMDPYKDLIFKTIPLEEEAL